MTGGVARATSAIKRRLQERRFLVDLAFAGFITVLAAVDANGADVSVGQHPPDTIAYALIVVAGTSLLWRRHASITVLAVVTVAMLIYWLRDYPSFLALLGLPALYAVAVHCQNRRRAWIAIVASTVALMVGAGISILNPPD